MRKKITLIGSGNVGQIAALRLAELDLADIVLIGGVHVGMATGKALDLSEASPIERHNRYISGATGEFKEMQGSSIVVISAGVPRKPGMSREDLLETNTEVVRKAVEQVVEHAPEAIIIMVTNPLDAMCQVAYEVSGFQRNRIIGMAGVLDSARFAMFISRELDVSVENVNTFVLGGHGDTMVPLLRYTCVSGIPVTDLLSIERIEKLVERTRSGGAEIVNLLKVGSAYFAPACAVKEMVETILKDKKKIMPCSAYLQGEYGIEGIFMGVPVKLGENGIEDIVEITLTRSEREALLKSAASVRMTVDEIWKMYAEKQNGAKLMPKTPRVQHSKLREEIKQKWFYQRGFYL